MNRYLLAVLLLAACTKKKEDAPVTPTPTPGQFNEAQLVGTWNLTAATSSEPYNWTTSSGSTTNFYAAMGACYQQRSYTLQSGRTGIFKRECTMNPINGTWKLESDVFTWQTQTLSQQGPEKVTAVTNTSFTATQIVTTPSAGTTTVTFTYTKQ